MIHDGSCRYTQRAIGDINVAHVLPPCSFLACESCDALCCFIGILKCEVSGTCTSVKAPRTKGLYTDCVPFGICHAALQVTVASPVKGEKTLHVATWRAIQDLRARQQVLSWEWGTAHMESTSACWKRCKKSTHVHDLLNEKLPSFQTPTLQPTTLCDPKSASNCESIICIIRYFVQLNLHLQVLWIFQLRVFLQNKILVNSQYNPPMTSSKLPSPNPFCREVQLLRPSHTRGSVAHYGPSNSLGRANRKSCPLVEVGRHGWLEELRFAGNPDIRWILWWIQLLVQWMCAQRLKHVFLMMKGFIELVWWWVGWNALNVS